MDLEQRIAELERIVTDLQGKYAQRLSLLQDLELRGAVEPGPQ